MECQDREAWRKDQYLRICIDWRTARLTGCRYSTLKYYTEEGMLPFEQEEENLTRRYRRVETTVERIERIKSLKRKRKDDTGD